MHQRTWLTTLVAVLATISSPVLQAQDREGPEPPAASAALRQAPVPNVRPPRARGDAQLIVPSRAVSPDAFFQRDGRRLGLSRHDEMIEAWRGVSAATGRDMIRYKQHHRGVPVLGADYVLVVDGDTVRWGSGSLARRLDVSVTPRIDREQALRTARAAVTVKLITRMSDIAWGEPAEEALLLYPLRDGAGAARYVLAYSFVLRPEDTLLSYRVVVNADDGVIVLLKSEVEEAWVAATGSGTTVYDGAAGAFPAQHDDTGTDHRLHAPGVITQSMASATPGDWTVIEPQIHLAQDIVSSSSVFGDPAHATGVSAHYGIVSALDLFENGLGIDLTGWPVVNAYVDVPMTDSFAYHLDWVDTVMFGITGCPIVTLDAMGHEMGHFMMREVYSQFDSHATGETGSLHESFADIMGQLLERHVKGSSDWILAQPIACPSFLAKGKRRNLIDPTLSSVAQPDFYGGLDWLPTSPAVEANDYGHVHHNNSLHNKWFHLLAFGGQGNNSGGMAYDITGVGVETAKQVLLHSFDLLSSMAQYQEAADHSVNSGVAICGDFSQAGVSAREAWEAVGVTPSVTSPTPLTVPADGDTGVDPWPATLMFENFTQFPESGWVVEVAEDLAFTVGVQSGTVNTTQPHGGVEVGVAEFTLDAGREYFWRVRPSNPPTGLECWREVRSFTTDEVKVDLISPVIRDTRGEPVHPWELDFKWADHPKADYYAIEVSKSANFSDPLTQKESTTANEVVLDALVDDMQYWRVRPERHGPGNTAYHGSWSEAMFMTSMPAVLISNPGQGEQVQPWPVNFEWKPVKGADHYLFEIKLARSGWGDPEGEPHSIELDASHTSYSLNLRADEYLISYSWRVRVFGPKIEIPGIQEEGQPGKGYFKVRGNWTRPERLTKGPDMCVPLNQPLNLKWNSVQGATRYHVKVFEAVCPQNQSCAKGAELNSFNVNAQSNATQGLDYSPGPMNNSDALGVMWTVRAYGPDDAPGFPPKVTMPPILIQPTKPNMLAPDNMIEVEHGEPETLYWNTDFAHWGGFVLNVWKGSNSNCQGLPQFSTVVWGAANGQNGITLQNLQFDSGTHNHSWQVKPHVGGLNYGGQFYQSCSLPIWSQCATFVVTENTPPLTAPQVPPGLYGTVGSMLAMWTVVQGADNYQVQVYGDSQNGPLVYDNSFSIAYLTNHLTSLGQTYNFPVVYPVTSWVVVIPGTNPVNRYYYRVKACKGQTCGPWSDFSEWWETYPWPW